MSPRSLWPAVQLGEVLRRAAETADLHAEAEYREITVRLWGRGAVERGRVAGADIAGSRRFVARTGQLILSRIDARNGAIGVVPPELDGAVVTNDFPLFDLDKRKLEPPFLGWLTRTEGFIDLCRHASEGTTNRVRLKEERFLALEIPLPPLAEQQRIVARIEELAALIDEARALRREATEEAAALHQTRLSMVMLAHDDWQAARVEDVLLSLDAGWSPQCDDMPARDGKWGVLKTTAVQWCEFLPQENKALPVTARPIAELAVRAGDVLVTRAGPRKRVGVVAAVRSDEPQLMISDKLIRLRPDREKIEPRFLELCLASPVAQEYLVNRKTGLADAQVNISQSILKATPIAYPPLPEQRRIIAELDELQVEVSTVKRLQSETAAKLDALLPSILDLVFRGEL